MNDNKFRVINGYTVPAPEIKHPKIGTYYFTLLACEEYGIGYFFWSDDAFDKHNLKNGAVFLTEEAVKANAKALRGENPYDD